MRLNYWNAQPLIGLGIIIDFFFFSVHSIQNYSSSFIAIHQLILSAHAVVFQPDSEE